jgi:adenine specific DNA methylase Mod
MAKNLLSDTGVVFICIDDNEEHTLKKVCHNVFGEGNFVGSIILANYKRTHASKFASGTHEYILVYAKTGLYEIKKSISSVWDSKTIGDSFMAQRETKKLLNTTKAITCDKTVSLIKKLIHLAGNKDALVLDLYSRTGATAHSVMELNAEDGGKRNYILVQGTENEDGDKEQAILIRERIDLAGKALAESEERKYGFDDGFYVYDIKM